MGTRTRNQENQIEEIVKEQSEAINELKNSVAALETTMYNWFMERSNNRSYNFNNGEDSRTQEISEKSATVDDDEDTQKIMENTVQDIKNLKQTGLLQNYVNSFISIVTNVILNEDYAISLFVDGLRQEIGCIVKIMRPKTIKEAYIEARKQDRLLTSLFGNKKEYRWIPREEAELQFSEEAELLFGNVEFDHQMFEEMPLRIDLGIQKNSGASLELDVTREIQDVEDVEINESMVVDSKDRVDTVDAAVIGDDNAKNIVSNIPTEGNIDGGVFDFSLDDIDMPFSFSGWEDVRRSVAREMSEIGGNPGLPFLNPDSYHNLQNRISCITVNTNLQEAPLLPECNIGRSQKFMNQGHNAISAAGISSIGGKSNFAPFNRTPIERDIGGSFCLFQPQDIAPVHTRNSVNLNNNQCGVQEKVEGSFLSLGIGGTLKAISGYQPNNREVSDKLREAASAKLKIACARRAMDQTFGQTLEVDFMGFQRNSNGFSNQFKQVDRVGSNKNEVEVHCSLNSGPSFSLYHVLQMQQNDMQHVISRHDVSSRSTQFGYSDHHRAIVGNQAVYPGKFGGNAAQLLNSQQHNLNNSAPESAKPSLFAFHTPSGQLHNIRYRTTSNLPSESSMNSPSFGLGVVIFSMRHTKSTNSIIGLCKINMRAEISSIVKNFEWKPGWVKVVSEFGGCEPALNVQQSVHVLTTYDYGQSDAPHALNNFEVFLKVPGFLHPKLKLLLFSLLGNKYQNKLLEVIESSQLSDFLGGNCSCLNKDVCWRSDKGPWHDQEELQAAALLIATLGIDSMIWYVNTMITRKCTIVWEEELSTYASPIWVWDPGSIALDVAASIVLSCILIFEGKNSYMRGVLICIK